MEQMRNTRSRVNHSTNAKGSVDLRRNPRYEGSSVEVGGLEVEDNLSGE